MLKNYKKNLIILLYGVLFILAPKIGAQTNGLKFKGKDVSLDNRTELNLTPDRYLTFEKEFEISFDYKTTRLTPNSDIGLFGYILRLISKENKNVDLLMSISTEPDSPYLNLVVGNNDSIVKVNYSESSINNWIKLKIKFNLEKDHMIFYTPDSFYVQEKIGFKNTDDFKIIFGVNDFEQFKTSDVPTMSIRDIKIAEHGKLKHHWLLDESSNNIALDRISGQEAKVTNPIWLNLGHQIWESNFEKDSNGELRITSDTENGKIFIVGSEELTIFSTEDNSIKKIAYKNKPPFLLNKFNPIFNSQDNKIYCYLVENGFPHVLDINTGIWDRINNLLKSPDVGKNDRYYNRYYHPSDNSIYMFGGYGHHKYNNDIWKINIDENNINPISSNDSIFHPKYLSGLGALNDTLYILGGYGSVSGNQLINPQSYYDLIGYSIKDSTLFKKFDVPNIMDDMCVANSMWIDNNTRDYYALIYEKSIFNGELQLVKGNLNSPEFTKLGNQIPYQFLDVRSSAGLLYMENQNKLFSYTTYTTDSLTSQAKIYSIKYPPNSFVQSIEKESNPTNFTNILVTVICVVLFGVGFTYLRRKKKSSSATIDTQEKVSVKKSETLSVETQIESIQYQLIFFGGFQVINNNSEDLTNKFTPLLKELFLLILLHTYKNNKGISTEKITEVLWYDKTDKSAQNNRAVNFAKLRTLLTELGTFKLSKKTGYWKSVFDESEILSDYIHFLNLTKSNANLTKEKINRIIEITRKGPFLYNVQYPWLDEFKARVSDTTIDTLLGFAKLCDIYEETDFIIHLADSIFIFDVTNEDAMILKCKAQSAMGKHSHAKATYKKFSEEYVEMYGQPYEQTFANILKDEN